MSEENNAQPPEAQGAPGKTYDENYVAGLRKESAKYRTQFRAAQKNLLELQAKVETLDLDKYETLLRREDELEEAKARAEGNWEKLREKMVTAHKTKIEDFTQKLGQAESSVKMLEAELNSSILENTISTEAAKAKCLNPDLIMMALSREAQVEKTEKGLRVIRLIDKNGDKRVDPKTGKTLSIAQRIGEMKLMPEYAMLFEGAHPGGGSNPAFRGGRPDFNKMSPMQKLAWERQQMLAAGR